MIFVNCGSEERVALSCQCLFGYDENFREFLNLNQEETILDLTHF
jgi:hypothetical protein